MNEQFDKKFIVEWVCKEDDKYDGHWSLQKVLVEPHGFAGAVDVSWVIPEDKRNAPMNTYKEYGQWITLDDDTQEWVWYFDGLHREQWIEENEWTGLICENFDEEKDLYCAFNEKDFRAGSFDNDN